MEHYQLRLDLFLRAHLVLYLPLLQFCQVRQLACLPNFPWNEIISRTIVVTLSAIAYVPFLILSVCVVDFNTFISSFATNHLTFRHQLTC